MSMQDYSVAWTDERIARVEARLRDVHALLTRYYKRNGYATRVPRHRPSPAAAAAADATHDHGNADGDDVTTTTTTTTPVRATEDAVCVCGSFPLRTCVHAVPLRALHAECGVGVDLVLTMPEQRCSVREMHEGHYLARRHAFLVDVEAHLRACLHARDDDSDDDKDDGHTEAVAAATVAHDDNNNNEDTTTRKRQRSQSARGAAAATTNADTRDDRDVDDDDAAVRQAMRRLRGRVHVQRVPMHDCYANEHKMVLRLRFVRPDDNGNNNNDNDNNDNNNSTTTTATPVRYASFYVDVHIRPALYCTRAMSPAAARKHPLYTYLLLEDYLMPHHTHVLHELCVGSPSLQRCIVLLKSWAHHAGLTTRSAATATRHPESLSGFVLAAMVCALAQQRVLLPSMSVESATRAVWVQLARGYFTPHSSNNSSNNNNNSNNSMALSVVPVAEQAGEVAVLRLRGEVHNVLFRTSADFFRHVVQPAAERALQCGHALEVFAHVPWQPLQLCFDVALVVHTRTTTTVMTSSSSSNDDDNNNDNNNNNDDVQRDKSPALVGADVYFAPRVRAAHDVQAMLLHRALAQRVRYVTAWASGAHTMQLLLTLTSEADARSRLTRGPPIADAAAVAAFDAFWGAARTSTRQFPDGAIHRCVLWRLADDAAVPQPSLAHAALPLPVSTVLRHIVQCAWRRHGGDARACVRPLLGGVAGVLAERVGAEWRDVAPLTRRGLQEAVTALQTMLTQLPRSALPCKVTRFDVVAASERQCSAFAARPHLALTYTSDVDANQHTTTSPATAARLCALDTAATITPVQCVLTIDDKGAIPDSLDAIALMKSAICAQLAKALEHYYGARDGDGDGDDSHNNNNNDNNDDDDTTRPRGYGVRTLCTRQSVDVVLRGYLFRIYVAHYREVSLLRALQRHGEASVLEQKLFYTVQHAMLMRSIAYGHPSFTGAVRVAKRWMAAMLLAEFVLPEAIELLVAHAYLDTSATSTSSSSAAAVRTGSGGGGGVPHTVATGFVRFLYLLATHDWTQPLVLPGSDDSEVLQSAATTTETPRHAAGGKKHSAIAHSNSSSHRSSGSAATVTAAAARMARQPAEQQAMFLATPYAPLDSPFTLQTPRAMIMHRLVQLARDAWATLLRRRLGANDDDNNEGEATADATRDDVDDADMCEDVFCAATERALFACRTDGFDLTLQLHPQLLTHTDRAVCPLLGTPSSSSSSAAVTATATTATHRHHHGHDGDDDDSSNAAAAALLDADDGEYMTRVWQLDELPPARSRAYIAELTEREPAAHAVRVARAAIRDHGMLFYDALAPRAVHAITVTDAPTRAQLRRLHDTVVHVTRGALLPVAVAAATRAGVCAQRTRAPRRQAQPSSASTRTADRATAAATRAPAVSATHRDAAATTATRQPGKRPRDDSSSSNNNNDNKSNKKSNNSRERAASAASKPKKPRTDAATRQQRTRSADKRRK